MSTLTRKVGRFREHSAGRAGAVRLVPAVDGGPSHPLEAPAVRGSRHLRAEQPLPVRHNEA